MACSPLMGRWISRWAERCRKVPGTDSENSNDRLSLSPEKLKRRTVYLPLRRANLPSLLNLFDFGDAATVMGKRQSTNVAPQALFMMNSGFVSERTSTISSQVLEDRRTYAIPAGRATSDSRSQPDTKPGRSGRGIDLHPSLPKARAYRRGSMAELLPLVDGLERVYLR